MHLGINYSSFGFEHRSHFLLKQMLQRQMSYFGRDRTHFYISVSLVLHSRKLTPFEPEITFDDFSVRITLNQPYHSG